MKDERRSDCPIACTLDIVGDRWTLLVLRDLFLGKRRFDEFISSPEGIASNVLSERLTRLEREGLIVRERDQEDARRVIYTLTERGKSLWPIMKAIVQWGLTQIPGTKTFGPTRKGSR